MVPDEYCQSVYRTGLDWLAGLEQNPQPLQNWLKQNQSSRLGFYFEQLVAFWLRERIAEGYYESHCRVFREKRVLGEFDFLFTETDGGVLRHWETAVKFYLCFQESNGELRWYGPNAKDRLDLKLARMMDHQLRLSEMREGQALLAAKGFQNVLSQAFLKGYLFYPAEMDWQNPALIPRDIAAGHLTGWWTRINCLQIPGLDTADHQDIRWCILPRLEWLAPRIRGSQDAVKLIDGNLLLKVLREHFVASQRPLLLAEMRRNGENRWQEHSRGFVVCDSWPEIAV